VGSKDRFGSFGNRRVEGFSAARYNPRRMSGIAKPMVVYSAAPEKQGRKNKRGPD
jgi:hypothetical protein